MAEFKKIRWTEHDVRCPFFITEERRESSIRCEGYSEGVKLASIFKSAELKNRHMGRYCCCGNYEWCPVYRLANQKY